jgi:hypothetical protein
VGAETLWKVESWGNRRWDKALTANCGKSKMILKNLAHFEDGLLDNIPLWLEMIRSKPFPIAVAAPLDLLERKE